MYESCMYKNKYEGKLLLTLGKVYDVIDERSVLGYLIVTVELVINPTPVGTLL